MKKMRRMSLKVFLTKLRRLRGEFEILDSGLIRTSEKHHRVGSRVGSLVAAQLCPIERVAGYLGFPVDDESLPLQRRTRSTIITAADDAALPGPKLRVRRQMLKALGLWEA